MLEAGEVVFEGEDLVDPNPNAPASQLLSKEALQQPTESPTKNPVPIIDPNSTPSLRTHRDSLAGLPQYEEASYGRRKH